MRAAHKLAATTEASVVKKPRNWYGEDRAEVCQATPCIGISMSNLVKADGTSYVRRLISKMRDPLAWKVVEDNDGHYMKYYFDNNTKSITYCPFRIRWSYSGSLFSLRLSDAPDISLSFFEGIRAYLAFRSRVKQFLLDKSFDREQRSINFLRESGV
jgi:hypothetical protein